MNGEFEIGDKVEVTLTGVIVEKYDSMCLVKPYEEPNSQEPSKEYKVYLNETLDDAFIQVEIPCDYDEKQIKMVKIKEK